MFRPGSVGSKPVRPLDVLLGYEPGSFPVQVVGNISSEHCGGVPLVLPLPGGAKTGYHGLDRIPKEVPGTFLVFTDTSKVYVCRIQGTLNI